jgi:hypothetical protein
MKISHISLSVIVGILPVHANNAAFPLTGSRSHVVATGGWHGRSDNSSRVRINAKRNDSHGPFVLAASTKVATKVATIVPRGGAGPLNMDLTAKVIIGIVAVQGFSRSYCSCQVQ